MSQQRVEVIIKNDGTVTFELNGFVGDQCNALEELENMLGYDVKREDTEEKLYEIPDPQFINTNG